MINVLNNKKMESMKNIFLLIGIFLIVLGIAFFTNKVASLIIPLAGYYFFKGIPANPERMAMKYPEAFGINSYVPYVLMVIGLVFVAVSLVFKINGKIKEKKSSRKLPKFMTWKRRRTIFQFIILGLIATHIILYTYGLTTIKSVCPAAFASAAIHGFFGIEAVFWIFILLGTLFGGRFLCGWLCVFAPMQETADNILTTIGKNSREKKSLPSWFIYIFTLLFWGSIVFNIIININILTFSIANGGDDHNIKNIWGFVTGIITLIPLLVFFTYLWGSRFFCRNVCPIGGLLKILSRFGLVKVKIDQAKCVDCSSCTRNCQMNVNIDRYIKANNTSINDGNCILCGDCIDRCPKKALNFGIR